MNQDMLNMGLIAPSLGGFGSGLTEKGEEYQLYFGQLDPTAETGGGGQQGVNVNLDYNNGLLDNMRAGWTVTGYVARDGTWKARYPLTHTMMMTGKVPIPEGKGFGDTLQDFGTAISKIIKAAAPFIAMIPGVGTVVGAGLYAIGSLGEGDTIDQVVLQSVEQVIPEGPMKRAYKDAIAMGYAIARGKGVGGAAIELSRTEALASGGPKAVAFFDAGLSIGQGKGLQDAGFKALGAWAQGNDVQARAAAFIQDGIKASKEGKSIKDFLLDEGVHQFVVTVPALDQAVMLHNAIQFFLDHPNEMIDPDMADLADRLGIPIDAIRAAIICIRKMADGTLLVDDENLRHFTSYIDMPDTIRAQNAQIASYWSSNLVTSNAAADAQRAAAAAEAAKIAALQQQGAALSSSNPGIAALRYSTTDPDWRYGFDVAIAATKGTSQPGPGQITMREALPKTGMKIGFDAGQQYQHAFTLADAPARKKELDSYIAKGAGIAQSVPTVGAIRASSPSKAWTEGFDAATGACDGHTMAGAGQTKVKTDLMLTVGRMDASDIDEGFTVAQGLSYGLTKAAANGTPLSYNPQWAAGQAVIQGVVNSSLTSDQKATAVNGVISGSADARAGAAATLPTVAPGFFHRLLAFFGLVK